MPENITMQIVLAITGCIALLIGLFGGGVKAKEVEIPKIRVGPRILSSLVGVALIGTAIKLPNLMQQPEQSTATPVPATDAKPTQVQIIPASATSSVINPTNTSIPKFGWSVYFEIVLKEGYWKPGTNSYELLAYCPDVESLGDIDKRIEFSVDQNTPLFPNKVVEFHLFCIPSPNHGEPNLTSINPNQKTKIVLGYTNISLEQATQAINECQVKAIINDKWTAQMSPIGPTPE